MSRLTLWVFQVNWWEEQQCFHDIIEQLAQFYTPRPPLPSLNTPKESSSDSDDSQSVAIAAEDTEERATREEVEYEKHQLEHILFPAFRRYGNFPKELMNQSIRKLTDLPQLYKVFERC